MDRTEKGKEKERGEIQRNEKKPQRRLRLKLVQIGVVAAIAVVIFTMGAVWSRQGDDTPIITSDLISERLTAVSELATLEYHYTNMGKFENQVDFYGWKVPLTRKRFIVSYDGILKAGIDAAQIAATVKGDEIFLTLPPAKILSHEIDNSSMEIFDETTNIFNPLVISDYTGFAEDQRVMVEQRAIEKGLLAEAEQKAMNSVEQLLRLAPDMARYTITVLPPAAP